jgi:hypothetical protein
MVTTSLVRRRLVVEQLIAFGVFILISVALTWPLAAQLNVLVSDNGDPLLNAWIINWDQYAATHGRPLFDAPIFFPSLFPLAYSENLFCQALLTGPFYLAGCPPLVVYNIAMLLGFALCGYGAYVLARVCTGSRFAGLVSGVLYGFVPFRLDHTSHLQVVWGGWLPLLLASLLWYRRAPSARRAALLGVLLVFNGLTNVHWLLFGTTAVAITLLFLAAIDRPAHALRYWLLLLASLVVAMATLVPMLLPYKRVSAAYGMRREASEVLSYSASWHDWLVASPDNATYGALPDPATSIHERRLFPGMAVLLLSALALAAYAAPEKDRNAAAGTRMPELAVRILDALIGLDAVVIYLAATAPRFVWKVHNVQLLSASSVDIPILLLIALVTVRLTIRTPRAWRSLQPDLQAAFQEARLPVEFWCCALWIVVGVLGAFGLNAFFHHFLFYRVEAFRSLRVPARWAMIAYVGLAGTAAFGTAALERRTKQGRRLAMNAALLIGVFLDVRPQITWEPANPSYAPVYEWVAREHLHGPILELPINEGISEQLYLHGSTRHHQMLINGTSGFEPPVHATLTTLVREHRYAEISATLRHLRTTLVIIHNDFLGAQGASVREWLRRALEAGTIVFVRRFESGGGGDWVFAFPDACRQCVQLRGADVDRGGLSSAEELGRMLAGGTTYSNATFGQLESPYYDQDIRRNVAAKGWALSPHGIRGVQIILQDGRQRIAARLVPRPDITMAYPWYSRVPAPGFVADIPRRPGGVRRRTMLQVEITDGAGEVTRLPAVRLYWE